MVRAYSTEALLAAPFMHIDETPLQVLRSAKAVGSEHYIVVRAAGPPGRRIILYDYIASRTTEALKQLLVGPEGPYPGKLISDGLERYDEIAAQLQLLHFGCLTPLPHDIRQGAQGQPAAVQPHAGQCGH